MSQMFRTTLRLDLDKPASANAVALLRQLHAERGLSYSSMMLDIFFGTLVDAYGSMIW